jgi:eukaryotic translation initiation factor 2C
MALDVVMRHRPSMKYTTVGRSFFTHNCSEYLSEGAVEAWQGYYQSVRPAQGQMMVNIDISATAFYRPGSLLDRLTQILHCRTQMQIPQYLDEIKCRQLDQIYKGVKFRVTHRGKENRIYKIQKFTRQGADKITFKYGDTNITVKEYFKNNYQQLYLPTCPCIVDHKGNYFPIEVCDVIMVNICSLSIWNCYINILVCTNRDRDTKKSWTKNRPQT